MVRIGVRPWIQPPAQQCPPCPRLPSAQLVMPLRQPGSAQRLQGWHCLQHWPRSESAGAGVQLCAPTLALCA